MPTPRKKRTPTPSNEEFFGTVREPQPEVSQQKQSTKESNNQMNPIKLVVSGVVFVILLVLTLMAVKIVTVEGNQLGIKETWSSGVQNEVLQPKTYFLFPGWSQTVYKYDASSQVFVMNDKSSNVEKSAIGREKDAYLVQSTEGQDMKISLNLRWRIDPAKLVSIHKTVRSDVMHPGHIEEKIIRPVVMRVVKDEATRLKAIEAYSGEGLVKLQAAIQNALAGADANEGKELRERGVIVENFVIEHIGLDPQYMEQITKKTTAIQSQQRAVEEQKAAEADALVAKAKAQADLNTQVVGAERDAKMKIVGAEAQAKQVTIAAEAQAQQVTIAAKAAATQVTVAAEAEKQKMALQGEGMKLQQVAESEGILAIGKAKAQAQQLLLDSWKAAGPEAYAKVEIAKSLAEGTKGVQGYLPNNFNPTIISDNFMGAIQSILGPHTAPAAAAK